MKTFILFSVILLTSFVGFTQSVGIGTTNPDASAALDVSSTNKGFVPPRVVLTAANIAAPVVSPTTGLLVYNTNTSGTYPNNVMPGYYYWNGSIWYPIINKGNAFGDMQYWNGLQWVTIPIGSNGSVLTVCSGIPKWGGCGGILTINPNNNPDEGELLSFYPNAWANGGNQVLIEAWTSGGQPFISREVLRFDYSGIPSGATIDSAKLYLYADPAPGNGNFTDAMFGSSNAYYIQRITSAWSQPSPYSWNNQPGTTSIDQAIVPQSNSSFENTVVNVTALVKDMLENGNNGFFMKLVNEVAYNSRQYVSSFASDASKHPKLVINYH